MPSEFAVEGIAYRAKRLSAAKQFALFRLLTPILPTLSGMDVGLRLPGLKPAQISKLLAPLSDVGDETLDLVFAQGLAACERVDGEDIGAPGLSALLSITMNVVSINFGPMFAMKRPEFDPCPNSENDKGFGDLGPVSMPDGEDWLYAPAMASPPLCRLLELEDGTYQIEHVAKMNDLLTVRSENEARLRYVADQG